MKKLSLLVKSLIKIQKLHKIVIKKLEKVYIQKLEVKIDILEGDKLRDEYIPPNMKPVNLFAVVNTEYIDNDDKMCKQ